MPWLLCRTTALVYSVPTYSVVFGIMLWNHTSVHLYTLHVELRASVPILAYDYLMSTTLVPNSVQRIHSCLDQAMV